MREFSFEKLIVWEKSRQLAVEVYKITSAFPVEERFGLTSQIRRCSISVPSNIAEGSGRNSKKDNARFTEIAFSSLMELLNQLIDKDTYFKLRLKIEEIGRMINALRKTQLNS